MTNYMSSQPCRECRLGESKDQMPEHRGLPRMVPRVGSVTSLHTSADRWVGTSGVSRRSQLDAWHIVPQRDAIEATGVENRTV